MTARTAAKPPVGQKTRIAIIPALATARTRHAMVMVAIGSWRSDTAPVNSPASSWATAMTVRNPLTHGTERSSPNTARTNHRLMIFAASDVARLDRKSLQRSRHTRWLPSHPIAHNATRTKNHSINGVLDMTKGGGLYDIMT